MFLKASTNNRHSTVPKEFIQATSHYRLASRVWTGYRGNNNTICGTIEALHGQQYWSTMEQCSQPVLLDFSQEHVTWEDFPSSFDCWLAARLTPDLYDTQNWNYVEQLADVWSRIRFWLLIPAGDFWAKWTIEKLGHPGSVSFICSWVFMQPKRPSETVIGQNDIRNFEID